MRNRPAVKVLIPYLAGIILADKLSFSIIWLWILSAICISVVFVAYKKRWLSFGSALLTLLFLFLGFLRYEADMIPPRNLEKVLYKQVKVHGTVLRVEKERRGGSSLILKGVALGPSVTMNGKILVRAWNDDSLAQRLQYGDVIELEGRLTQSRQARNPGEFDYRKYLQRSGIFASMNLDALSEVQKLDTKGNFFLRWTRNTLRKKIETIISKSMPNDGLPPIFDNDPCAIISFASNESISIAKGITLGARAELSEKTYQAFIRTGTVHIMAISGTNFGIIAMWTFWICKWIAKRVRWKKLLKYSQTITHVPIIPLVIVYACVVDPQYSVLRALIFIIMVVISKLIDRDTDLFNLLALSALVILIFTPGSLWDVGFQLSFGVLASITYFMPYWQKGLPWLTFLQDRLDSYDRSSYPLYHVLGKILRFINESLQFPSSLHQQVLGKFLQNVAVSSSAQIGALLIIAHTFSNVSLSGFIANIVIFPLIWLITPIGLIQCVSGLIYLPLALVPGYINHFLISMLNAIVDGFSGLPFSSVDIPANWASLPLIIVYLAIIIFIVNLRTLLRKKLLFKTDLEFKGQLNRGSILGGLWQAFENNGISLSKEATISVKKPDSKWLIKDDRRGYLIKREQGKLNVYEEKQSLLIAGLAILTICVWASAVLYDGHVLEVTYLDVGHGDSIFVDFPDGSNILIDGGSYSGRFDSGSRIVSPFLRREGVRKLDLIISTHPDNDHAGGLTYVVDNFSVDRVITGRYSFTSPTNDELLLRLNKREIKYSDAQVGTIFNDGNTKIEVLGPLYPRSPAQMDPAEDQESQMNNNSVVLKITYKKVSFLFTGDIERPAELQLVNSKRNIRATVLKVPHHGSASSNSWEFLRAVQPTVAVISVGYPVRPSPIIMGRYNWLGIKTYRTDWNGAITIITDGRRGWVKTAL